MITLLGSPNSEKPAVYIGLSTDTKPTDSIPNGSVFVEIDTENVVFYDGTSESWLEEE